MKFILTVFSALLVISCNKDTIKYSFSGIVTETAEKGPLAEATVQLYQTPFNNSLTSNNYELAGGTTTAVNGSYQFSIDREKVTSFRLDVTKDNYFDYSNEMSSDDISSEKENIFNPQLDAKSWIRFDIENVVPANASDELTLLLYNYREGCDGCATNDYNYLNGTIDTNLTYVSTAGAYFKFMIINVTTSQTALDSIYMTPFDTTVYQFNY
jgi:hypothetical protein